LKIFTPLLIIYSGSVRGKKQSTVRRPHEEDFLAVGRGRNSLVTGKGLPQVNMAIGMVVKQEKRNAFIVCFLA